MLVCKYGYRPIISSVLYANYNSIVLIPMLIPLKEQIKNKKQIIQISAISFTTMFMLTILIFKMQENMESINVEMPMLYISSQISQTFKIIFGIMTAIAIFTSAISAGYSLICNITRKEQTKKAIALVLCLIAIPVSQLSFSTLVNLMYPIFGILGTLQIIFLLKS